MNSALFFPRVAHRNRTQPNVAKREEIHGANASRIRWRRILNVNVIIEVRSLVSEAPKHFKLAMASRRAAFSGNTLLPHCLVILVFLLSNTCRLARYLLWLYRWLCAVHRRSWWQWCMLVYWVVLCLVTDRLSSQSTVSMSCTAWRSTSVVRSCSRHHPLWLNQASSWPKMRSMMTVPVTGNHWSLFQIQRSFWLVTIRVVSSEISGRKFPEIC